MNAGQQQMDQDMVVNDEIQEGQELAQMGFEQAEAQEVEMG